jgi:hypothetical protein
MIGNKGLGAGESIRIIIFIVVLAGLGVIMYQIAKGTMQSIHEGEEAGRIRLKTTDLYTKIISSPDCLSTGEIGILDQRLLEEKNGNRLKCAYLPSFKLYTEVGTASKGEDTGYSWSRCISLPKSEGILGPSPDTCNDYCDSGCAKECPNPSGGDEKWGMAYFPGPDCQGNAESVSAIDRSCDGDLVESTDSMTPRQGAKCCCKQSFGTEKYSFGDDFTGKAEPSYEMKFKVGIKTEDGEIKPGKISLFFLAPIHLTPNKLDFKNEIGPNLVEITRAAAVAWKENKNVIEIPKMSLAINEIETAADGNSKKVCVVSNEIPARICKEMSDVSFEENIIETNILDSTYQRIRLTFVREGNKIKISKKRLN